MVFEIESFVYGVITGGGIVIIGMMLINLIKFLIKDYVMEIIEEEG